MALHSSRAIPQLAEGFWTPKLPDLDLLKAAPGAQNIPGNRSIPFRFALGGGATAILCIGQALSGTAPFQELFPSWLKDLGPGLPHLELLKAAPNAHKIAAYPADLLLEVVPKLAYAPDRC